MKKYISGVDGRQRPLEPVACPEAEISTKSTITKLGHREKTSPKSNESTHPERPAVLEDSPPAKRHRAGPGRRPLLTPAVQAVIIEAISAGCPYNIAAAHAGIDHDTLRIWRRKGEQGIAPYVDFVKLLAQAEIDWEVAAVKAIHAAGDKDWRAHLELLSRRIPERWARANREMNPGIAAAFSITINLGDPADDVHTTLALAPAIDITPPKDPDSSLH